MEHPSSKLYLPTSSRVPPQPLHSDETRPMAQRSPASTFLGTQDWPHGTWGLYTSNGPIIFAERKLPNIPQKSPWGQKGNSNLSNSVLFVKNQSSGGCTPNINTPEPPKKKNAKKKNWNQPSKSTTSNSWRMAHQSDALRFDSHGWIVQYSTGVASAGLASNKCSPARRTKKWVTLPGFTQDLKKGDIFPPMKNWR